MTPQQEPVEAASAALLQPSPAGVLAAAVEAGHLPNAQPAAVPAPSAEAAIKEDDARRAQRRERHRAQVERKRRWELRRSLADISADVELLTQEVARARHACMPAQEAPRDLTPAERSQLAALHTRRLTDIVAKQCTAVLKHVQNHKWAWPFAEPVELDRYPDYLKAVKQPMDFGTIRRRLEGGVYGAPAQFAADMGLVWANARTYNAPGSDVYFMVGTLQERFEDKWNSTVVPKLAEDEAACRNDEANMRRRIAEGLQRGAGEALAVEAARLSAHFEALQARIEEAKSQAAAACQPMPREHKRRLVEDVARLPPEQYEWAIAIILARYPGAAAAAAEAAKSGTTASETLSLDLSAADALTLRQLQHFIAACQAAGGAPGDGPSAWPGMLVGSGVQAFKAPGKRPRTARSKVRAPPIQAQQPPLQPADSLGGGGGIQKLATPAQKLPALTLKLPSPGGARAQPPQPNLSISVPPATTTPGSSQGPLTAQGSSTVPSLPAGVAAAQQLPQVLSGAITSSSSSLPPDTVTHDGFKVPPLPKHRTQSLPTTLSAGTLQQPGAANPGAAANSGAAEGVAAAEQTAAAGHTAAQRLPSSVPGDAGGGGAARQAAPLPTMQQPAASEAPPACTAASSPATAAPTMMDAKQISEVCAFLHSDVDMTEAGPPS